MPSSAINYAPEIEKLSPRDLDFDFQNPRLMDGEGPQPNNEKDMVDWLWKNADVLELVESIAQSGWMQFDDMVVMQNPASPKRRVVLEGNRRLAALKLFIDPKLAKDLAITLPSLPSTHRASLENIYVKKVNSREAARAYIGFKHINGPHKWDAYAKAKYAVEWLDDAGNLNEIARTLGDNHNTVRRLVIGYRVLEQAKNQINFRTEDAANPRGFAFSHLYTALGQTGYQSYLGLQKDYYEDSILKNTRPIKKEKIPHLKEIIQWLYGSVNEKRPPIITSQNPNLGELNSVLQSPAALNILKSEGSLSRAFEEVESRSDRFIKALVTAYQSADQALLLSSNYDGKDESVKDTSGNLKMAADTILLVVTDKVKNADHNVPKK